MPAVRKQRPTSKREPAPRPPPPEVRAPGPLWPDYGVGRHGEQLPLRSVAGYLLKDFVRRRPEGKMKHYYALAFWVPVTLMLGGEIFRRKVLGGEQQEFAPPRSGEPESFAPGFGSASQQRAST